jgi:serine/threonine protein kinase
MQEIYQAHPECPRALKMPDLRCIRSLGEGGYGIVALAKTEAGALVAVKVIPKETVKSRNSVRLLKVTAVSQV